MSSLRVRLDALHLPDDPVSAGRALAEAGLGDGLPMIVPTTDRVGRLLDGVDVSTSAVRFPLAPEGTSLPELAIVGAMAGCEPMWFRVVVSALAAMSAPEFNLLGVLTTTSAVVPLVLVRGPLVDVLGLGSTVNALVNPAPANRAIGRSVSLAMRIFGNALPGVPNPSTLGHPAKVGWCVAEGCDANPWAEPGASAVAVAGVVGSIEVVLDGHTVDDDITLLASTCDAMARAGLRPPRARRPVIAVVPPETAQRLAGAGYGRDDLARALGRDVDAGRAAVTVVVSGGVGIKGAVVPTWGAGEIVTIAQ